MSNALSERNPDQRQALQKQCAYYRDLNTVSFADDLSRAANEPFTWALMFVPVAALWIIGGIVIGTLRWIGRGFGKTQKTPAPSV